MGVGKGREEEGTAHGFIDRCYDWQASDVMTGRRTSEGGEGSTRKPPPAILQHSPAIAPPSLTSSSATGQKLLQVKHESRGGGAEKKLGVCWRENSRGHELPAVVFKAALLPE